MDKPRYRPIRKLAELTTEFMADAFKKQGFAATELVTRWSDIVGAEIAIHAEPVKLQWPREVKGEAPSPPPWSCASRDLPRWKSSSSPR